MDNKILISCLVNSAIQKISGLVSQEDISILKNKGEIWLTNYFSNYDKSSESDSNDIDNALYEYLCSLLPIKTS